MDVFGRLAQTDRINIEDDKMVERQRRALAALAQWAADCMAHDEAQALGYGLDILQRFDEGSTVDRLIAEVGTDIERAGKPSAAGLAGMVYARAMQTHLAQMHGGYDRRRDMDQYRTA